MTEHAVNRENKTAATESPRSTEAPTTANPRHSLSSAIGRHIRFEKASFHTPGHKGRQHWLFQNQVEQPGDLSSVQDLTELPGLDDLSAPHSVIADIEKRAARLWHSKHAFVSVNGASAALTAAIMASACSGAEYALMPRNAHRSAINALCLARLKPIWYEPLFDPSWDFWGASATGPIEAALNLAGQYNHSIACVVVVSPTYGGTISDIAAIASLTRPQNIPLIVDEAHGAHFLTTHMPPSAIACGADAVAHSWHKTLPALTQTGALHLPEGSLLLPAAVRSNLNLITSSSPSYLLLASLEKTLTLLEEQIKSAPNQLQKLALLSSQFRHQLSQFTAIDLYGSSVDTASSLNCSHILLRVKDSEPHHLYEFLQDRGIFCEAMLGRGVLFMLGLGSQKQDIELALATIKDFIAAQALDLQTNQKGVNSKFTPPSFEPVLPPHQAMFLPHETVPAAQSLGRIAAQCLSPCPPGIPILIPGQKITEEVLAFISDKTIEVVAH